MFRCDYRSSSSLSKYNSIQHNTCPSDISNFKEKSNVRGNSDICQIDGNITCESSETSTANEPDKDSINESADKDSINESSDTDSINESSDKDSINESLDNDSTNESEVSSEEECESNIEDNDKQFPEEEDNVNNPNEQASIIPVVVGNRPSPQAPDQRKPVRKTIKRDNKIVEALSLPKMTLYNVRSAWSKWSNISEDMEMRDTDVSFLTEVWEKSEHKKHQKAIESMLEIKGIKYVSTPRPGARRGGGTALACSQQKFILTKLNIAIPAPLEACFGLVKPKNPTGKINKYICCSFYAPPRSRYNNKLAEFLVSTIGRLRTEHPGCRVILAGDRNDLKIDLISTLDPTLKQVVKGYTNKMKTKVLDVFYTDCHDLLQEATILPPMQVDDDKVGKDSDHAGVELLPRTNLAPMGSNLRERKEVQPFPESRVVEFGFKLLDADWSSLDDDISSTDVVDRFVHLNDQMVAKSFPKKQIQVGPGDLPYFTEELRHLKRQRLRAYSLHGKRSEQYTRLKIKFEEKLVREGRKYVQKIESEVKSGKRGSGYKAIRKLGNRPGESWHKEEFILPTFVEQNLSPLEAANRLANHFSGISQSVDPLDFNQFSPSLRQAVEEGRTCTKPILTQHQVYYKMLRVTKPNSSVEGDIPKVLLERYAYQYAAPLTTIFNKIIQASTWPRQWLIEQAICLSKSKTTLPLNEDSLRTISKTPWASKCLENILGDFLLPVIDKFLDPGQCGGLKKSSTTHYLIKLLDFAHRTLDKREPHAAVLCTEDLSKAYNRGSHNLVIEDLHSMHAPKWILVLVCSYLENRSLILTYQKTKSSSKTLPGGFGAGTWLGGLLFLIKFNGACLRPPIPRPITKNLGMQVKFIDDASQIASVNLKKSLLPDTSERPRPLNYHERTQMILDPQENILQQQLDLFYQFTQSDKFVINQGKCFVMQFSRSKKYDFPPEFTIGGSGILDIKKSHTILGIIVQDNLKWDEQVQDMVRKAMKITWVLRRMRALGVGVASLVDFWKSEGRVQLEKIARYGTLD